MHFSETVIFIFRLDNCRQYLGTIFFLDQKPETEHLQAIFKNFIHFGIPFFPVLFCFQKIFVERLSQGIENLDRRCELHFMLLGKKGIVLIKIKIEIARFDRLGLFKRLFFTDNKAEPCHSLDTFIGRGHKIMNSGSLNIDRDTGIR